MANPVVPNDAFKAFGVRFDNETMPLRPVDAYKAIIDQLVTETSHSVTGKAVAESSSFSEPSYLAAYNRLTCSLTPEQRVLLSEMLHEERSGAIHDVLAVLTWWILTRDVGLTFRGEPMPVELSGMGLHGDYVGRLQAPHWEWPE